MNKKSNKKFCRKGLQERRNKILKAATEIFAEKGVERATIDDIAARAGVGKGTIYRQVGRKEDFINVLCQHAAKLTFDAIKSVVRKRSDPIFQFKEVVNVLCDIYETNSMLLLVLMTQLGSSLTRGKIEKSCATRENIFQVFGLIENILRSAIKKGQIHAIDTRVIVKGLFYFLNPHSYQELRSKFNYTKSEITQLTIDLFLNGLKSRN